MYFVEKYNAKERRWETIYKGQQASATELCYTLSKEHPERSYRRLISTSGPGPISLQ